MLFPKLDVVKPFDPWRSSLCTCPLKCVVHPYTGCSYRCLYCYATSYIPNHHIVRVKHNFLNRLERDVVKMPKDIIIELSSSSDPYPLIETRYSLTRGILHMLLVNGFRILIVTKSVIIVRDLDILTKYRDKIVISMTITTQRDNIAMKLEPGAPLPSERLKVIEMLINNGINVVVRIDPIIPYINDDYNDIKDLIKELSRKGVKQIISSTYKARSNSLKKLVSYFPEAGRNLLELYSRASHIHGYRYLDKDMRFYYMRIIKELTEREGLVFTTCREGFPELNTPGFLCDGSTYLYNT